MARTTKAKKVLNPPFRTAGPIFCRAVIDRSVRDPTGRKIISYFGPKKQNNNHKHLPVTFSSIKKCYYPWIIIDFKSNR